MRDAECEKQDARRGNRDLSTQLNLLGRKPNVFIESVERSHRTDRAEISKLAPRIAHLAL